MYLLVYFNDFSKTFGTPLTDMFNIPWCSLRITERHRVESKVQNYHQMIRTLTTFFQSLFYIGKLKIFYTTVTSSMKSHGIVNRGLQGQDRIADIQKILTITCLKSYMLAVQLINNKAYLSPEKVICIQENCSTWQHIRDFVEQEISKLWSCSAEQRNRKESSTLLRLFREDREDEA